MVVTRDQDTARAIQEIAGRLGHDVILDKGPEEALRLVRAGAVEVVLIGRGLPPDAGRDFCREARRTSGRPYTYVAMIADRGDFDERRQALLAGADGFLLDATDTRELVPLLENARRTLQVQRELLIRSIEAERMQGELRRQNERLAELVARDHLTGLYNRRHLLEAFEAQVAMADRLGEPLSLIMLDVDYFKSYNDEFGHLAGDELLRQLAEVLRLEAPGADIAARYGGEEFALLLLGADQSRARLVAERVRDAVNRTVWPRRQVRVSLGVSTRCSTTRDGLSMLEEADQALYHSKRSGRNKVTHWLDLNQGEGASRGDAEAQARPGPEADGPPR